MATDTLAKSKFVNPPDLACHFVDVVNMPWEKLGPGTERKVLYADPATGRTTCLFRQQPGSIVPFHEHPELEQTYVLEGRLVDDEGEVTAGNFVWRPGGSRHEAHAPDGCLFLAFFMKPSKFMPKPE